MKVNYAEYIRSEKWLGKHSKWLKSFGYCAAIPLIHLGKSDNGYHSYNMHHAHYKTLGRERFWWDVLPLSSFAHKHIAHGVLSFYKRPSEQRTYPNLLQRVFHAWCRLMILIAWFWWILLPLSLFLVWKIRQDGFPGLIQ